VILVTGGTGFVGPRIVHALREREQFVRAIIRRPRDRSSATLASWGAELVPGDMGDAASLRRAVEGAEVVVHLVSIRQGSDEDFRRVMDQGTRDLVAAAKEAGVRRFVLMSALGTSEANRDLVPYYRAKWDVEQLVKRSGLDHVIFRPSFIFGPDGGIIPTFRRLVKLAPVTPIIGSGERRIQPIWVDDVAAYFGHGLDLDAANNRTFELGGPDPVTWNDFWARFKLALGVRLTERLPGDIPLTRDLLKMLEHVDNVVTNDDAAQTFQLPLVSLGEQLRRLAEPEKE
jgi:uncharacterized protein YbjT (DUF2867 family)